MAVLAHPTGYAGALVCVLAALVAATGSSGAASSSTVVSVTVPSATNLVATGCAAGVAGRTDFGTVLPGTSVVTSSDCVVVFGSSNNSSQLRIGQSDRLGIAMYSPTRGQLDPSFDGDGLVTTPIGPGANEDRVWEVAVQDDGKVVTAGECDMGGANGRDACLARFNMDGSLDSSFDTDGRVNTATGAALDAAYAIAIQADGKIVTAGQCDMGVTTGGDSCLARYNSDGSLDTSFDVDGRVTTATAPGGTYDYATAIAVQADGKIVTAGVCDKGATGVDACLVRYNPDGSLDASFDDDGQVATATGAGAATDHTEDILIQVDGRIITSGYCDMGVTGRDACLARYTTDGALDTSFGGDGRVTTTIGAGAAADTALAVAIQPDGRIVAAGYCDMGTTGIDACLARHNTDGSLDTSFDTDGLVTTATGATTAADYVISVAVQADGRIVTTGYCDMGATGNDACLARYNTDGSLDTSFDTDGRVTTATGAGAAADIVTSAVIHADGRIVTAGFCDMGGATGLDACLATYDEQGLVSQYANDGVSDWDTAGTAPRLFGACLRSVSGGASSQWATSATCTATDGAHWNAVPSTPTKVAYATALEPDPADATANFRFGMRTSADQPPGSYIAPITFEVLAPNS